MFWGVHYVAPIRLAVKIPSEALEAEPVNDFETLRGSEKRLQ